MTSLALNRSVPTEQSFAATLRGASQQPVNYTPAPTPTLLRAWQWLQAKLQSRTTAKPLQLAGSLALGEKRSIFVVEVSGRKFLVGGTPTSMVMLADLGSVDAAPEPVRYAAAAKPVVKKEPRRRALPSASAQQAAPALLPQASHRAALPVAAKTVAAPRRPRKKPATEPVIAAGSAVRNAYTVAIR